LTAALALPLLGVPIAAGDGMALEGDAFVGASVFLFERTVLIPFAPAATSDTMLDAGVIVLAHEIADEDGAAALEAMLGWLAAAPPSAGAAPIGAERQQALTCLAFGADPAGAPPQRGVSEADRAACATRYAEARETWLAWLQPYRRKPGAPADDAASLRLAFAPAIDEGDQAIADAMRENGLFQALTDDLNAALAMPRPITALLTRCGEARAFYNPDRGEAVLCYELLAALLKGTP
jgi:hypothetical protein